MTRTGFNKTLPLQGGIMLALPDKLGALPQLEGWSDGMVE